MGSNDLKGVNPTEVSEVERLMDDLSAVLMNNRTLLSNLATSLVPILADTAHEASDGIKGPAATCPLSNKLLSLIDIAEDNGNRTSNMLTDIRL